VGSGEGSVEEWNVAYRLKFSGRAVREVGEAYEWYEARSQGLGAEFESALELQLRRLEQALMLYPEVLPGIRRTLLPRFPYGVFYVVRGDLAHILAVIHSSRHPRRWPGGRAD
jgi:plasmid stabilization system protein ParE